MLRLAGSAAVLTLLLAQPGWGGANRIYLAEIAAGIESKTEVANLAPALETQGWEEQSLRARSFQMNTVSSLDALPVSSPDLVPGFQSSISGLDFSGHAGVSYVDKGIVDLGIGYYLKNANRQRISLFDRLASQSGRKAELVRKNILLRELKGVLLARNALERMEAEIRSRRDFAGFVDSLLARLEPYAKSKLISSNSLNNVHALKEANAITLEYLQKETGMLMKGVREETLVDTVAFHALDIGELVDSIETRRRAFPAAHANYADRFDSVAAEMEKEKLLLNRIQDSHLLLGVGLSGNDPRNPDGGVGLGLNLEWKMNFGIPPPVPLGRAKPLPTRTVAPLDPDDVRDLDERTDRVSKMLRESIEGRLTDIRLGQTASVYSISENLGYLLAQPLQAGSFRASYRERSLSAVDALEDLSL